MNNNDEQNALTIPSVDALSQATETFEDTQAWIGHLYAIVTGTKEGTPEEVQDGLAVINQNISGLKEGHVLSSASIVALTESVKILTKERDEAYDVGYEQGAEAAEEYLMSDEYDPEETWIGLKDHQDYMVDAISKDLILLGETAGAEELRSAYAAAVKAYEEAERLLEQYHRFNLAHWEQIWKLRQETEEDGEDYEEDGEEADSDEDEE